MMTPEERDALIDVTVEACAKVAENFHQRLEPPGGIHDRLRHWYAKTFGSEIAAAIRKEFAKP